MYKENLHLLLFVDNSAYEILSIHFVSSFNKTAPSYFNQSAPMIQNVIRIVEPLHVSVQSIYNISATLELHLLFQFVQYMKVSGPELMQVIGPGFFGCLCLLIPRGLEGWVKPWRCSHGLSASVCILPHQVILRLLTSDTPYLFGRSTY